MLTPFDAFLIVFFLMLAVLILGAAGLFIDSYLDPGCNCAAKRRQEHETQGVKL